MKRKAQRKPAPSKEGLVIRPGSHTALSPTQVEFNRLMKSLESTRDRHSDEQARLDEALDVSIRELMPLIESLNRINHDLVVRGYKALVTLKLTPKRHHSLSDLLADKASSLLSDPVGLTDEDLTFLEELIDELDPPGDEQEMEQIHVEEFNHVRTMMEQTARQAGLDLDLSDLDASSDPEEFHRIASDRLRAALEARSGAPPAGKSRQRKPTKAQIEKERKRLELEEAKNRDLKSLFKQLAKAFHPDLEPDPLLKEHKKVWMQRLNTAYASNDLREMLQLEMEWLGEEATNLATAGDEKLKVYCMVLKEQIADLKAKIHHLKFEPQYGPLQRFIDPFYGTLASPASLRRELRYELERHREMVQILDRNDANARRMIYAWADQHALRSSFAF